MKLSIIIPVFNEVKTIGKVLSRVQNEKIPGVTKQIVVVDDGSWDGTSEIIKTAKGIKKIFHEKNQGKGAAVKTGLRNSTGEYIIIQDADLEYEPKFIKDLLKPIRSKKTEVVYGTRLKRMPNLSSEEKTLQFLAHYIGNRFLSLVTSLLYGQWITDMETGYKLFPKKALSNVKIKARGFEFEPEITAKLMKNNYKIFEVPIKAIPRGYDEGKKINTVKDGFRAFFYLIKYRFTD